MSHLNTKTALSVLLTATLLATPPASSVASAQEAITLETVGAVRMLSPSDAQRRHQELRNENAAQATETMWFADAYATAYYTLDQENHELVARVDAGPKGGNPVVVRRKLDEGAIESIAINGSGRNGIQATLVVERSAGVLRADVVTEPVQQSGMAGPVF